jgi:hypothetical protein
MITRRCYKHAAPNGAKAQAAFQTASDNGCGISRSEAVTFVITAKAKGAYRNARKFKRIFIHAAPQQIAAERHEIH